MQARRWQTRPSELLGIEDVYVAYCLDEAVLEFAAHIESELNNVKVKGDNQDILAKRREAVLESLLTGNVAKRFADPALRAKNG